MVAPVQKDSLTDYQVALARLRKAMGVLDPLAPQEAKAIEQE